jgi:hypothetical protein
MFSNGLSISHHDLAGPKRPRGIFFQEGTIIIVRHETDLLALGSLGGREFKIARARLYCRLEHAAKWKEHAFHLVLCKAIQKVALVFLFINALFEDKAGCRWIVFDTSVMSGSEIIETIRACVVQKQVKLDKVIALNAGVRRAAVFILGNEVVDNVTGEFGLRINYAVRYVETDADRLRRADIAAQTGCQLHGNTLNLAPLFMEERGSRRTVNAAAHGHKNTRCHIKTDLT